MPAGEIDLYPIRQYQDWLKNLAPGWFQGPEVGPLLEGLGQAKDEYLSRLLTGVLARFLYAAPEDAVNRLGSERGLNRYPGESLEGWRARVLGAWDFWQWSGTEYGMGLALSQLGYNSAIVPVWTYAPARWSEFDIYLYAAGRSYDGSLAEQNRILGVINQVKPAHTKLGGVQYIPFGNLTWDPPALTWDAAAQTWGGAPVVLYP